MFKTGTQPHSLKWQSYLVALLIIAAASAIRSTVFSDLGRGTSYLTYYPAVVLALPITHKYFSLYPAA